MMILGTSPFSYSDLSVRHLQVMLPPHQSLLPTLRLRLKLRPYLRAGLASTFSTLGLRIQHDRWCHRVLCPSIFKVSSNTGSYLAFVDHHVCFILNFSVLRRRRSLFTIQHPRRSQCTLSSMLPNAITPSLAGQLQEKDYAIVA